MAQELQVNLRMGWQEGTIEAFERIRAIAIREGETEVVKVMNKLIPIFDVGELMDGEFDVR